MQQARGVSKNSCIPQCLSTCPVPATVLVSQGTSVSTVETAAAPRTTPTDTISNYNGKHLQRTGERVGTAQGAEGRLWL